MNKGETMNIKYKLKPFVMREITYIEGEIKYKKRYLKPTGFMSFEELKETLKKEYKNEWDDHFNRMKRGTHFKYEIIEKEDNLDALFKFIEDLPKENFETGDVVKNVFGDFIICSSRERTKYGNEFKLQWNTIEVVWGGTSPKTHPKSCKDIFIDKLKRHFEYDNEYIKTVHENKIEEQLFLQRLFEEAK